MPITERQLERCEVDLSDLGHSLVGIRKQIDDDHERMQLYVRSMGAELLHLAALLKQLTTEARDV